MRSMLSLTCVALLLACNESPVPLSEHAEPFDASLVGTWQVEDEGRDELTVLQFDSGYYYVEMPWGLGVADTTRLRARAYLSRIGSTTFANVQDIQGADRTYLFYRLVRHADGTLSLTPLKNLPRFGSPDSLRAYVAQRLADDDLFDSTVKLRRKSTR